MDEDNGSPSIEPSEIEDAISEEAKTVTISKEEYENLQRDAREYKEKYLHALAEGENSRKRLQRERQEAIQHSMQSVIVEFLNPIDQLENALKYAGEASPEVRNWAIGFEMILTQFKDVLASHGVSAYVSEGLAFDPHCHEAIEVVPSAEHLPGTVIKEYVRGYKSSNGKVIRPARVHVSKAVEQPNLESETINE